MEDKNTRAILGWRLEIIKSAIAFYRERGQKEADELESYRQELEKSLTALGGPLPDMNWQVNIESEFETV
ncbi:MAG: hypothetical protein KW804_00605 [Candidatus Doudnabacteria bacterium]|nr:hypothetical protein [Candidatus Doudnabacteria bacterium]